MVFATRPKRSVFVPPGGVPPVPDPGQADPPVPLSRHRSDGLQPPGLPGQTLVSCVKITRDRTCNRKPFLEPHCCNIMIIFCWNADSVVRLSYPFGWFQLVTVVPLCCDLDII